jgi:ketosteroid isomerase-like protein|tara:strand:- start:9606 stop:9800 length:195 start_codon:yes stop_codon:yes gene_type:complete
MRMRVKGKGKVEAREVENDLLWALEMDKEGKIRRSTEFIDAVAAGRIKEIMGEQGSKSAEDVES